MLDLMQVTDRKRFVLIIVIVLNHSHRSSSVAVTNNASPIHSTSFAFCNSWLPFKLVHAKMLSIHAVAGRRLRLVQILDLPLWYCQTPVTNWCTVRHRWPIDVLSDNGDQVIPWPNYPVSKNDYNSDIWSEIDCYVSCANNYKLKLNHAS